MNRLVTSFCSLVPALLVAATSANAAKLVGKAAPSFSLTDQHGKKHELSAYKGKTVVLEWTNPQCPFVVRHYDAKTMKSLAEKFGSKDIVWLAVNSSHFVKHEDSKAWAKKYGHSFPTLLDKDGKVGKAYNARTTPHMFVIDGKGVVQYEGAIDSDPWGEDAKSKNYVDNALQAMMNKKPVDPNSTKAYGCSVKYKR
ncbi:MAG: thioredoxin family protein [Myxococcota bacterium]|nr:thioredoxin family protein [Myxococcota bacterium]